MPTSITILGFSGPTAASRALRALAAAIVATVVLVAGVSIWQLHRQAERAARLNAENAAAALAAHAQQVFSSASYVLDGLCSTFEAEGLPDVAAFKRRFSDEKTNALLRAHARSFRAFDVLSLVAADGDLVNFSRGFPVPSMNIREREGVDPGWGDGRPKALLITAPRVALINGRWTFYLVRQLRSPEGRLLGIIQVGIGTAYFSDFYERLRTAPDTEGAYPTVLTLLRADGVVLSRAPLGEGLLGKPFAGTGGATGEDPLLVVRDVEGFAAKVAATTHADAYLAGWRSQAIVVAGFALLSAVLLSVSLALMVRVMRRREFELAADRQLRLEAERATRAKTEFLSTITHELRTPMNGVIGTGELLLNEPLPERHRELVETLLGSGRKLLGIINDILDLTKIEAGEVPVQHSAFDPAAVPEEVCRLLADAAKAKGLTLTAEVRGSVPAWVKGDAGHVREVLIQLAGNALKFTERGRVVIAVARAPSPGGTLQLRYMVEDSGIGLSPQARALLFKPFAQVDASAQRRHEGAGLGLALAQRVAGLLGGRLDFEPLPDGGTRFWFDMPAPEHGDANPTPPAEAPCASSSAEGGGPDAGAGRPWPAAVEAPHVLVVEDNPVNAMIVQGQLAAIHCTSELAVDGEEALALLRRGGFDLVLMDCMMPRMSGYDATTLWRAIEHTEGRPHLPIVALTANTLASNVALCAQAGMDDFLSKPLTLERLRAVVQERVVESA